MLNSTQQKISSESKTATSSNNKETLQEAIKKGLESGISDRSLDQIFAEAHKRVERLSEPHGR